MSEVTPPLQITRADESGVPQTPHQRSLGRLSQALEIQQEEENTPEHSASGDSSPVSAIGCWSMKWIRNHDSGIPQQAEHLPQYIETS